MSMPQYVSGKIALGRKRRVPVDRILQETRITMERWGEARLSPLAVVRRQLWLCVGTEWYDGMEEHDHAVRVLKLWKRVYGGER